LFDGDVVQVSDESESLHSSFSEHAAPPQKMKSVYATVNVASSAPVRTSVLPWMAARPNYTQQPPSHKRTPPRFPHHDRHRWAKSAGPRARLNTYPKDALAGL